jgi:hypothetical protein
MSQKAVSRPSKTYILVFQRPFFSDESDALRRWH